VTPAHQWRGVVEEYRDRLPVTETTPVVTLGEGGPAGPERAPVRGHRMRGVAEVRGRQPDGLVQGPGMTVAMSKAVEEGSKAVVCASTGNTSASAPRTPQRPASSVRCWYRKARSRWARWPDAGPWGPGDGGRRELRRRPGRGPRAGRAIPGDPRQLGEPLQDPGAEDSGVRGLRRAGPRSDYHLIPVGNAGNITAYWMGYTEYFADGLIARPPVMFGFQAAGAAPMVEGRPVPNPATIATAIRIGNPASWEPAAKLRPTREARSSRSPTARSSTRTAGWPGRVCSPRWPRPRPSPAC